jgi:hypothetical protein
MLVVANNRNPAAGIALLESLPQKLQYFMQEMQLS